jgi:hypothetical protein
LDTLIVYVVQLSQLTTDGGTGVGTLDDITRACVVHVLWVVHPHRFSFSDESQYFLHIQ